MLRSKQFSIIIDESTSVDSKKSLCVIVRYVGDEMFIHEDFLTLIEVPEATAEIMFSKLVEFFDKFEIPYKQNFIAFASDGASVMVGRYNSVSKLFKDEIPGLFTMRCICHTFHIIASKAVEKLPDEIEKCCREIYSHFNCGAKR